MRSAQESVHVIAATVGFISFFLLWFTVVWGVVLRNGWMLARLRHATAYGAHQSVALVGLCLGVVHTFAQLAAPLGPVRLIDIFVPFLNTADPIGLGAGVIALELMLAVAGSILIQRLLGFSRWRALHSLTYVAFMLLAAHLLISGSDVGPWWVWGSIVVCWLVTVLAWLSTTRARVTVQSGLSGLFPRRRRVPEVTVNVDARLCARFGFCEHEAPEVFRLRSDGRLSYRAAVPADEATAVIRAVEVCPVRAIALGQVANTVLTPPKDNPRENQPVGSPGARSRTGSDRPAGATHPGTVTELNRRRGSR